MAIDKNGLSHFDNFLFSGFKFMVFLAIVVIVIVIVHEQKTDNTTTDNSSATGAIALIAQHKELKDRATEMGIITFYENDLRLASILITRADKNKALDNAMRAAKKNKVGIALSDFRFEVDIDSVVVNVNATDEEIIKFLVGVGEK